MKCVNFLHAGICWLLLASTASAGDFKPVEKEQPIAPDSTITEMVWRAAVPPGGEFDVIGLHRFHVPKAKKSAALLYLPGTNMNGELAVQDERHNLWLYLAARGITVYTLDYRTHFIPDEHGGPFDFMKEWTLARFTDDVELALDRIRGETDLPVFVAGFSRGATFAFTLAGRADLDGLIILDGSFKEFREGSFDRDSAMKALHKREQYVSILSRSRGWENRQELMRRAWQNPDGPALDHRYANAGKQLEETLYNAWGRGGLANPRDGISSVEVLGRLMEGYDRFYPMIQNIEGQAMASFQDDPGTTLDDHFGEMSLPIIYFGATNLGTDHLLDGIYSVGYSGSRDVTYHVLENYGHIDVLVADDAVTTVYGVVADWIGSRL